MKNHERCVLRGFAAEAREGIAEQIALHDAGPDRGCDPDRAAQVDEALGLLWPDQGFEPCNLLAIREIDRVEIEPGAPGDVWTRSGKRRCLVRGAAEHRLAGEHGTSVII